MLFTSHTLGVYWICWTVKSNQLFGTEHWIQKLNALWCLQYINTFLTYYNWNYFENEAYLTESNDNKRLLNPKAYDIVEEPLGRNEVKAFKPGLKICPGSIHVTDDVTHVAHDSRKYKDSKEKHTSSEDILLYIVEEKATIKI